MAHLLNLPNELFLHITRTLSHQEILNFLLANRRLSTLLRTAQFDRLRRYRSPTHGEKAVCHAAEREDTATVVELIGMGAHKFKGYPTCFSYAIKSNCSAKAIRALLRSGIEADSRDFWGRTPLAIAAREGRTDIVEMLLKVDGVNVNSRCCGGRTPFMFAALTGHADVVRLLLEDERVDVSTVDISVPPSRSTLLWRVTSTSHYDVAKLLLESPRIDHEAELLGHPENDTVLFNAAEVASLNVVKLLLDDGRADPNLRSIGHTPLFCAIRSNRLETVRLLLADPRVDPSKESTLETSPIHLAAWKKGKVLAVLLQDRRVDVNSRNRDGETPLFTAVKANALDCVKLFLKVEGIDLFAVNNFGLTVMMAAKCSVPPVKKAIITVLGEAIAKSYKENLRDCSPDDRASPNERIEARFNC